MQRSHTMTKLTFAFAPPAIMALLILGCASFNESPSEVPDETPIEYYGLLRDDTGMPAELPRGTPIGHDEIPDTMRTRHAIPDDASVERYGDELDNAQYRVQHADGTVYVIGPY